MHKANENINKQIEKRFDAMDNRIKEMTKLLEKISTPKDDQSEGK